MPKKEPLPSSEFQNAESLLALNASIPWRDKRVICYLLYKTKDLSRPVHMQKKITHSRAMNLKRSVQNFAAELKNNKSNIYFGVGYSVSGSTKINSLSTLCTIRIDLKEEMEPLLEENKVEWVKETIIRKSVPKNWTE